jgi:hypothetical protein
MSQDLRYCPQDQYRIDAGLWAHLKLEDLVRMLRQKLRETHPDLDTRIIVISADAEQTMVGMANGVLGLCGNTPHVMCCGEQFDMYLPQEAGNENLGRPRAED